MQRRDLVIRNCLIFSIHSSTMIPNKSGPWNWQQTHLCLDRHWNWYLRCKRCRPICHTCLKIRQQRISLCLICPKKWADTAPSLSIHPSSVSPPSLCVCCGKQWWLDLRATLIVWPSRNQCRCFLLLQWTPCRLWGGRERDGSWRRTWKWGTWGA